MDDVANFETYMRFRSTARDSDGCGAISMSGFGFELVVPVIILPDAIAAGAAGSSNS